MTSIDSASPNAARRADYFFARRDMWIRRARHAARERDIWTNAGEVQRAANAAMLVQQYARVARFNNWNALLVRRGDTANAW